MISTSAKGGVKASRIILRHIAATDDVERVAMDVKRADFKLSQRIGNDVPAWAIAGRDPASNQLVFKDSQCRRGDRLVVCLQGTPTLSRRRRDNRYLP